MNKVATTGPNYASPPTSPSQQAPIKDGPKSGTETLVDLRALATARKLTSISPGGESFTADQDRLSPAGRHLGEVLRAALTLRLANATIMPSEPLIDAGPPSALHLANELEKTISKSGLFYESHLAEWAADKRSLQDLSTEPQLARDKYNFEPLRLGMPPDPSTAQLVSQQLSAQEQSRVTWSGQVWPGQALDWDIERGDPTTASSDGSHDHQEAPDFPWKSNLRLSFPDLGEINATVILSGGKVSITMRANNVEACQVLLLNSGALYKSLDAAGSVLTSLVVDDKGQSGNE
jgi:hypothetical protein